MTRSANVAAGQIKATSLHAVEELACLQRIGDARPHAEPLRRISMLENGEGRPCSSSACSAEPSKVISALG